MTEWADRIVQEVYENTMNNEVGRVVILVELHQDLIDKLESPDEDEEIPATKDDSS